MPAQTPLPDNELKSLLEAYVSYRERNGKEDPYLSHSCADEDGPWKMTPEELRKVELRFAGLLPGKETYFGWVYFISDGEKIKIGYSGWPPTRLDALQASTPTELSLLVSIPGDLDRERCLHATFRHLSIRGEWFRAGDDLIRAIHDFSREDGAMVHGPLPELTEAQPQPQLKPKRKAKLSRRAQCNALADQILAQAKPHWEQMPHELKRIVRWAELSARRMSTSARKHEKSLAEIHADLATYATEFPKWLAEQAA